jgi:hypothetical protein
MANTHCKYESYRSSYGNSAARGYIKEVQIGTINNVSAINNGYGDFTSMSTNLTTGEPVTPLSSFLTGQAASEIEYHNIWIDLTKMQDFDDDGEPVFSKSKTKS